MSTDLELSPNLPKLRLPTIKLELPRPQNLFEATTSDNNNSSCCVPSTSINNNNDDAEECSTPTSDNHKIPLLETCPPAPRKPRRVLKCKRKLSELDFFELQHRHEVESFFVDLKSKRRCAC